jgi:hypothetical protein
MIYYYRVYFRLVYRLLNVEVRLLQSQKVEVWFMRAAVGCLLLHCSHEMLYFFTLETHSKADQSLNGGHIRD